MNPFNAAKKSMFNITTKTMGYDVIWVNSDNDETHAARVHFNDPTENEEVYGGIQYEPIKPWIEYKIGDLPGLKSAADANRNETVTIDGVGEYYVRSVSKIYDGDTYKAILEIKE